MEDTEYTSDSVSAALTELVGFSSFGAQNNANKRRRYNPHADAVVASDLTSTMPPHHSGLPQQVISGSNATPLGERTQNEDEIDLEEDDEERCEPVSQYGDAGPPILMYTHPQPQPDVVGNNLFYPPSSFSIGEELRGRRGRRGGHQARRGQGRESGEKWWEGYYDPSSNINPWERLEQAKGLEPRGSWMSWEEAKK